MSRLSTLAKYVNMFAKLHAMSGKSETSWKMHQTLLFWLSCLIGQHVFCFVVVWYTASCFLSLAWQVA